MVKRVFANMRQWIPAWGLSPGGRIITAVVLMAMLLVAAGLPLVNGLKQSTRLAATVSGELVPNSIRVMSLVNSVLEAQSAMEAFLLTGSEDERNRYHEAMDLARVSLKALHEFDVRKAGHTDGTATSLISGIDTLLDKLETEAAEVFALHDRPDNALPSYLINTRGEQLLERSRVATDMLMDAWFRTERDEGNLFLSALMGYQDSLGRMMSAVRGYMFMKEERFRDQYRRELVRNENIYALMTMKVRDAGPAANAFLNIFSVTRTKTLSVFERAFIERDAPGWRQDQGYYRTRITPTLESLKWVLYTLSDTTSQAITEISAQSMHHGAVLESRTALSALALALLGGFLALWIYQCVRLLTRQIGSATATLDGLSSQLRAETEKQTLESSHQVAEIGDVSRTLNALKDALGDIRGQTEEMAHQTDAASLECVQGMEVLCGSQESMSAILRQAREIEAAMHDTQRQTEAMDGILAILNELVDQTKLLSFNATIEAAGAGRFGARFAVVAKQVRHLANRSQEATGEIRGMIKQVQEATENTRKATERGNAAVGEGENLMTVVTERLDVIVGAVSQISDVAGSIFLAAQSQSRSVEQVDRFVDKARQTAERVSSSSEQSQRTVEEMDGTAKDLARLVGK